MTIRRLVIVAAACLLLASGHTNAQAPPAPDTGQRLQALEQKMDRIQQLLEGRAKVVQVDPVAIEKTIALLNQARETLAEKVEKQQQAYQDFRVKIPFTMSKAHGSVKFLADRLAND